MKGLLFVFSYLLLGCQCFVNGKDSVVLENASIPVMKKEISYGADPLQKMDVYLPNKPKESAVLFMVHGGGWKIGDKANQNVYENKVKHWVSKDFIFISVNYRLLPKADVITQAIDVVLALIEAQKLAKSWGGDPSKFILMGHSAGAHLIALISSDPSMATNQGAQPWLGSILLDSAAMNVPKIMESLHFPLYDKAFGTDHEYWKLTSPFFQLKGKTAPILAVCSSRRDASVSQSKAFVEKALTFGTTALILPVDLSHGEINTTLGLKSSYTDSVDRFINSLLVILK